MSNLPKSVCRLREAFDTIGRKRFPGKWEAGDIFPTGTPLDAVLLRRWLAHDPDRKTPNDGERWNSSTASQDDAQAATLQQLAGALASPQRQGSDLSALASELADSRGVVSDPDLLALVDRASDAALRRLGYGRTLGEMERVLLAPMVPLAQSRARHDAVLDWLREACWLAPGEQLLLQCFVFDFDTGRITPYEGNWMAAGFSLDVPRSRPRFRPSAGPLLTFAAANPIIDTLFDRTIGPRESESWPPNAILVFGRTELAAAVRAMVDSLPAPLLPTRAQSTIAAETKCGEWLAGLMREGDPTKAKKRYEEEAHSKFDVGTRAFNRAWDKAITDTGNADWKKPGRKSRRRIDTPSNS